MKLLARLLLPALCAIPCAAEVTPAEARAIAKEAYIYGYLLNSPMLPDFSKDADGGLTLHIQNESPGQDREANWLPAPKGPFSVIMRLYWPKEEALDGQWTPPPVKRAD